MAYFLKQHKITVFDSIKKNQIANKFEIPEECIGKGKETSKYLITITIHPYSSILDLGPSHHMASLQDHFSTFEPCTCPTILMEDNILFQVHRKGIIELDDEKFHNGLGVPSFSTNIVLIYQITRFGTNKQVEFTPDSVVITKVTNGVIVVIGKVDHHSNKFLYLQFHFEISSYRTSHSF